MKSKTITVNGKRHEAWTMQQMVAHLAMSGILVKVIKRYGAPYYAINGCLYQLGCHVMPGVVPVVSLDSMPTDDYLAQYGQAGDLEAPGSWPVDQYVELQVNDGSVELQDNDFKIDFLKAKGQHQAAKMQTATGHTLVMAVRLQVPVYFWHRGYDCLARLESVTAVGMGGRQKVGYRYASATRHLAFYSSEYHDKLLK
jgi:hypothetical protein